MKALKSTTWAIPDLGLGVDGAREFIKRAEEAVVEPEADKVLPNPLGQD